MSNAAPAWDLRNGEKRALWHITCPVCLKEFEMRRRPGRKPPNCGSKWCVWISRYLKRYGRWPPRVWFERYAVKAGLIKLPKKIEKLARRAA